MQFIKILSFILNYLLLTNIRENNKNNSKNNTNKNIIGVLRQKVKDLFKLILSLYKKIKSKRYFYYI